VLRRQSVVGASQSTLVKRLEARERVMFAHMWRDGRLFGFDRVEWLTWLIAVAVIGVLALAVTI
jgi:hypothetical protein